jgi:hypothetical protein
MNEGYHSMGNKASYNDNIPAVKIILQHNRKIEEGEQRYRNIAKIFLENQDGERFLAPTTRPGIAQVYARHIAEGGVPNDERWNHVKALCEEYSKMGSFVRATKNKQFNESAQQLVSEGINHYQSLRETLGKLRGHRGYNMYFESWTPALMEDDTDSTINELFVQETVDPRIESVMPILARLNKNKATTTVKEVEELAEWADQIVEGDCEVEEDLDADQKRVGQLGPTEKVGKKGAVGKLVGANESVEINEDSQDSVANALYTRITRVRTDLITKYGIGAINDAIDEVSSQFAGEELDEIGSSDVSGWIRQLEQILANSSSMSEGYRPGEINNSDQVQIKKDSPYYEPGTWTVSQCTDGSKCWIGDEDDRGWYIRTSELELADSMGFDDDDDFDPDFVYGKSEPEDDVDSNDFGDFGDDPRDTDPLDEIKRLIK